MSNHTKNSNLKYLTDPKFHKVNILFVLLFENEDNRTSYEKQYTPTVDIKHHNVFIDVKTFFDIPAKSDEEVCEKNVEIKKNNDYATSKLLRYENFSKHRKLIATDLSKQIDLEDRDRTQQIVSILTRLHIEVGATMLFIITKPERRNSEFRKILLSQYKWKPKKFK